MKFKRYTLVLLIAIMLASLPFGSFASNSNDINITWQDDLDKSFGGRLTVQQYDVYNMPYSSQGQGYEYNVQAWQTDSIIFDPERLFGEPNYVYAGISQKDSGRNLDIIFYNNRGNYNNESKQSLKAWGYFVPKKSGYYRFKTLSDDGSYLSIFKNENNLKHYKNEETVLINAMSVSSHNDGESNSIYLNAKQPYLMNLKYFNWGGDGLYTFEVAYSNRKYKVDSNPNYKFIDNNNFYPSKKDDLYLIHGDESALINKIAQAKVILSNNSSEAEAAVQALQNSINHAETIIEEYYNYTQEQMDIAFNDIATKADYLENLATVDVDLVGPIPDDLLVDSKGKITIQSYSTDGLTSVYENDGTNDSYENNKRKWLNKSIIFDPDRKDGETKLYTAEIIKEKMNAAVEEIFFYDGGGSYGYDAKEIKEGWGYFVPNRTGFYKFETLFDDGIEAYLFENETDLRHYVNEGSTIANYYAISRGAEGFSRESNKFSLEAGKAYPIYINHFNWHGSNKLAMKYVYGSNTYNISSEYKDVPSSWFYASDKDEFFLIHGDKIRISEIIDDINAILNATNSGLTDEVIDSLRELLIEAQTMFNEYYNYTDLDIDNFSDRVNNAINGVNYSSKIKRYTKYNREYIEITEDFSDGEIDARIMNIASNNGAKSSYISDGVLYIRGRTIFEITEKFKDYDYVEIQIDQIANNDWPAYYAGVGVSEIQGNNKSIVLEYLDVNYKYFRENNHSGYYKYYTHMNFGDMEFDRDSNFSSKINYTSKLIGERTDSDKFNTKLNLYPVGEVYDNKLIVSLNNSTYSDFAKKHDFEQLYVGSWTNNGKNHIAKVDNLKIIAYKELKTVDAIITNFSATTNDDRDAINLSWDVDVIDFDSYVIKELIDGQIVNSYTPDSSSNNLSIYFDGQNRNKDREFVIYAKRGDIQSTAVATNWQSGIQFLEIEDFTAVAEGSKIVLSWNNDLINRDIIDGYSIREIIGENLVDVNLAIGKNVDNILIDQNIVLTSRKFVIEAYRGDNKSLSSEAIWQISQNAVTINQISGHTGKKLGVLIFEGNVSNINITKDIALDGYEFNGPNITEIAFNFTNSPQILNVMYTKSNTSNVDESNWQVEAFESINAYAAAGEIDFFEDSYYEKLYNTGNQEFDELSRNQALLDDFKRILKTAGATDLRDDKLEEYIAAIIISGGYANLQELQDMIDRINGFIDITNKDKNKDGYVDLVDNTKVTSHGFEFELATKIDIRKDSIYKPSFEFELNGNEYLIYQNPTVSLIGDDNKKISSKATIEYDSVNYKYSVIIEPTNLLNDLLSRGTYYVKLDTKTIINDENHSLNEIITLNKNDDINLSTARPWEFGFYVDDILVNFDHEDSNSDLVKINKNLSSVMKIKFKADETSEIETIISEPIKFEIRNTNRIEGGF